MSDADGFDPLSFSDGGEEDNRSPASEQTPELRLPKPTSRFAFNARIDASEASAAADDDPLSESLRGSTFFTHDPLAAGSAEDPLARGHSGPLDSDAHGFPAHVSNSSSAGRPADLYSAPGRGRAGHGVLTDGTTRIDTFASYGQLLSPNAYPGSETGTEEEAAAFGRQHVGEGISPRDHDSAAISGDRLEASGSNTRAVHDSGISPQAIGSGPSSSATRQPQQQRISRGGGSSDDGRGGARMQRPAKRLIRVGDPLKKLEAVKFLGVPKGGYVQFRVESRAEGAAEATIVRRRFSDFMALADLLKTSHRGYFLPPRPDKGQSPLQDAIPDSRFVVDRAATLERWLRQLQAHPVLCVSEELAQFLEASAPLMECPQWRALQPPSGGVLDGVARLPRQLLGQEGAVPSPGQAAQPTRATGDLLRRFKETATTMRNHPPPSDVEQDLQGQRVKLEHWLAVVTDASRAAEAVALTLEDLDRRTGDLGREIAMFAQFQDDDKVVPSRYTPAGTAVARLSALATKAGQAAMGAGRQGVHATKPTTQALQPLHEALAMAPAAIKALREREAALVTAQSLRDDGESRKAAIATLQREGSKVYGSDRGKARKEEALLAEVAALEQAETAAHTEYERVLSHNIQELDRWHGHCNARFAFMLRGLGVVRHDTAARSAASWAHAAADLSGRSRTASRDGAASTTAALP